MVAESHLEEWLIKPAEEEDHEHYTDDNQIKLFAPDEAVSWVATPIVDDWGHIGGLVRTGSHDLQNILPKVDPMVTLLGSFQNSNDQFMNSREAYDDDYKHEHWDEEAPGTPRFGANGYYSETDMSMVGDRDNDDHLQRSLLGGSIYGSGRYGNSTPGGRYVQNLSSSFVLLPKCRFPYLITSSRNHWKFLGRGHTGYQYKESLFYKLGLYTCT